MSLDNLFVTREVIERKLEKAHIDNNYMAQLRLGDRLRVVNSKIDDLLYLKCLFYWFLKHPFLYG